MKLVFLVTAHREGRNYLLGVYKTVEEAWDHVESAQMTGTKRNRWGDIVSAKQSVSMQHLKVDDDIEPEDVVNAAKGVSRRGSG